MKKAFVVLSLSLLLTGCGALVDLDTPKSAELKQEYSYYQKSVDNIRTTMKVTPEEADEIFLTMLDCGVSSEINFVSTKSSKDSSFSVWSAGTEYIVSLSGSSVDTVFIGKDQLYPENIHHNDLLDYNLVVKDVLNGTGDTVIGQYGYISIMGSQLEEMTADNLREFSEKVVAGTNYNWVSIIATDGNGICFSGSDVSFATYGKLNKDGSIAETIGTWTVAVTVITHIVRNKK